MTPWRYRTLGLVVLIAAVLAAASIRHIHDISPTALLSHFRIANEAPRNSDALASAHTEQASSAYAAEPPAPAPAEAVQTFGSASLTAQPEERTLQSAHADAYVIPILQPESVLDAMRAYASSNTEFTFETQHFAGLGELIESINGRKNAEGFYWTLYINDELSFKGASSAEVSPADVVEWRYQKGVN